MFLQERSLISVNFLTVIGDSQGQMNWPVIIESIQEPSPFNARLVVDVLQGPIIWLFTRRGIYQRKGKPKHQNRLPRAQIKLLYRLNLSYFASLYYHAWINIYYIWYILQYSLFSYFLNGSWEKVVFWFIHLRPDPNWGIGKKSLIYKVYNFIFLKMSSDYSH